VTQHIGFIGLGIMGRHMAGHLLAAGKDVIVYDLMPEAMQALVALGARDALSPRDVAARADLVISMVPDSPDVERLALGPDGLIEADRDLRGHEFHLARGRRPGGRGVGREGHPLLGRAGEWR
jgi:3-hydroxyisobutyrate dehydrogenase-like beta-hydroxyacid dehydrogenase